MISSIVKTLMLQAQRENSARKSDTRDTVVNVRGFGWGSWSRCKEEGKRRLKGECIEAKTSRNGIVEIYALSGKRHCVITQKCFSKWTEVSALSSNLLKCGKGEARKRILRNIFEGELFQDMRSGKVGQEAHFEFPLASHMHPFLNHCSPDSE